MRGVGNSCRKTDCIAMCYRTPQHLFQKFILGFSDALIIWLRLSLSNCWNCDLMPFAESRVYLHFLMNIDVLRSGTVRGKCMKFLKKTICLIWCTKTETVLLKYYEYHVYLWKYYDSKLVMHCFPVFYTGFAFVLLFYLVLVVEFGTPNVFET